MGISCEAGTEGLGVESLLDSGSAIFKVILGVISIADNQEGQKTTENFVREDFHGQDLECRSLPLISYSLPRSQSYGSSNLKRC